MYVKRLNVWSQIRLLTLDKSDLGLHGLLEREAS